MGRIAPALSSLSAGKTGSAVHEILNIPGTPGFLQATCGGRVVVPWMKVAETFLLRGAGLMGRAVIPPAYGSGLFFPNCRSLHTCFMKFPLHLLFLDCEGHLLELRRHVEPWAMAKGPPGTRHCAETTVEIDLPPANTPWRWTFRPNLPEEIPDRFHP